jgi:hypothetical protein
MRNFFTRFIRWLLGWTGLVHNPNIKIKKDAVPAAKPMSLIARRFMHRRTVRPGTKLVTTGAAKLKNSRNGRSRNANYARRRWAANHTI